MTSLDSSAMSPTSATSPHTSSPPTITQTPHITFDEIFGLHRASDRARLEAYEHLESPRPQDLFYWASLQESPGVALPTVYVLHRSLASRSFATHDIEMNRVDAHGRNALFYANSRTMVDDLIRYNVNHTHTDNRGLTALEYFRQIRDNWFRARSDDLDANEQRLRHLNRLDAMIERLSETAIEAPLMVTIPEDAPAGPMRGPMPPPVLHLGAAAMAGAGGSGF